MPCLIVLIWAVPTNTLALSSFEWSVLQWRTVRSCYVDMKYINYVTLGVAALSFNGRKEVTVVNRLTERRSLYVCPTPRVPQLPSPPARRMFGLPFKASTFSATQGLTSERSCTHTREGTEGTQMVRLGLCVGRGDAGSSRGIGFCTLSSAFIFPMHPCRTLNSPGHNYERAGLTNLEVISRSEIL